VRVDFPSGCRCGGGNGTDVAASIAPTSLGGSPSIRALLRLQEFRLLLIIAALVLGSHAMHDSFAMIRWKAAGILPPVASLLWSESVGAEVLVFVVIGPRLLDRIGPTRAMTVSAAAGVLRWTVMAISADVSAMAYLYHDWRSRARPWHRSDDTDSGSCPGRLRRWARFALRRFREERLIMPLELRTDGN
jgi:hypothetical protein